MRIHVIVTLLILAGLPLNAAKKDPMYRNGALTNMVLHVADDDGMPVADAHVRVFLGMNFRPKGRWIGGATDTNGVFVVEGKTCGDEIEICLAKVGYYGAKVKYSYAKMGAELPEGVLRRVRRGRRSLHARRARREVSAAGIFPGISKSRCGLFKVKGQ